MKRIGKIIIAMSTFALVAVAADNTLGTWKYNTAKSKRAAGAPPYKSLTLTREGIDGGVRTTVHVESADGNTADGVSTAKYDGKPVSVKGTLQWDTIAEKQIDSNTVSEEAAKQGGKYRVTRRVSVSADGKTMSITTTGTGSDGKAFNQLSVFEKQ
jgi:hypothetical protein